MERDVSRGKGLGKMDYWKIISKIANVSGIVFVVFSGLAALINYEYFTTYYTSAAPVKLIEMGILMAMLPYVISAVISFAAAGLISRAMNSEAEKQTEMQKAEEEAKREADLEEGIS